MDHAVHVLQLEIFVKNFAFATRIVQIDFQDVHAALDAQQKVRFEWTYFMYQNVQFLTVLQKPKNGVESKKYIY